MTATGTEASPRAPDLQHQSAPARTASCTGAVSVGSGCWSRSPQPRPYPTGHSRFTMWFWRLEVPELVPGEGWVPVGQMLHPRFSPAEQSSSLGQGHSLRELIPPSPPPHQPISTAPWERGLPPMPLGGRNSVCSRQAQQCSQRGGRQGREGRREKSQREGAETVVRACM